VKEEKAGSQNSSTDSVNSGLDRLPNLYTAWMCPLVRVTYRVLTQSLFRLDRLNSSSCDCPAKIHVSVDSNSSCCTCFGSGSSSPKVAEFCPTLRLVYFIARA
jgi:hypothetical protein